MKFSTSIGYFIVCVCSVAFSGTSSFELPERFTYTIGTCGNSDSFIPEQIPQDGKGASESLKPEISEPSGDNDEQLPVKEVTFHSYTKKNPYWPQKITVNSVNSVRNSGFQSNISTVFITHGWLSHYNYDSCTSIRDALLSGPKPVNVIVVDWSPFSMMAYPWSVDNVEAVGNEIARMINFLAQSVKLNLKKTTLIGHSLGAHVMGVAGKKVNGTVNQIYGLDPALSKFENSTNPNRLSKNCARNVQVIHTNAGERGLWAPLGHADFYPNGGARQPGCEFRDAISFGGCSHSRSYYLLAESFNPLADFAAFKSVQCRRGEDVRNGRCRGRVGTMGGLSNGNRKAGVFYLKTNAVSPFAYTFRWNKVWNNIIW